MTGRDIKVAVVDSGIVPNHPKIGQLAGGIALSIGPDGEIIHCDDYADRLGHGTGCAGIIHRKASETALYSVRIFNTSLAADGRLLLAALEWSLQQGMDIVNLSLGTTDVSHRNSLASICEQAATAGVILVAAEHNEGRDSYPAILPEVIGVAAGKLQGLYDYHYRAGRIIECVARGDEQHLCWLEPPEIVTAGTSFAAPSPSNSPCDAVSWIWDIKWAKSAPSTTPNSSVWTVLSLWAMLHHSRRRWITTRPI